MCQSWSMYFSPFAKQNQAEVWPIFQSLLKLLLWNKVVKWVKLLNALGRCAFGNILPLCVSSAVGCLWWSSSSSLSFWSTLSWKVFFLLKPSFQNPDTSIPTLTEPSVDVIFQELDHPLFSLLGFPPSTSKPDTWLKHTGSWLGFTWDDILSWPKDYGVKASLSIGINTTVFPSCEDPQPALEWTNVNLFGCWLVLRYTFSLE